MKKFFILLLFSVLFSAKAEDIALARKTEMINVTRLEGLRSECLLRHSGDQRYCRKDVLKQCRMTMEKRDCLLLMSKMQKSKMPRTNGPGLI